MGIDPTEQKGIGTFMNTRGYQYYKEESLNSMTQGELLLRLYDELVKRLTQAELSLKQKDYVPFENAVDRSVDIIHYLSDTLDHQYEISASLDRLYEYFCYELSRVKAGRNQTELSRVKTMVSELRESFRQADKTVGGEEAVKGGASR